MHSQLTAASDPELLAAYQALLHRYSGQEDVIVGTPIANRHHAQTEPLIGFFVNTLALRANFAGNPAFSDLLARIREMALGAVSPLTGTDGGVTELMEHGF